jgi:hypothetical protein
MKSAEEITDAKILDIISDLDGLDEYDQIKKFRKFLKKYAQSRQPEITDEEIEAYVKSHPGNTGNIILDRGISAGFKVGAKAMRDGLIPKR